MVTSTNLAEQLVARLTHRSFLALWSYAKPRGKKGKELCDVLAVCDPSVVIFSVKDLAMPASGSAEIDWQRWHRGAIEESVKQIYGAERWLQSATNVIRSDGTLGLALPDRSRQRIHRVAVALGSGGSAPIYMGDFGKGFVHVLAEDSLEAILSELDTVTDLVSYLIAKEEFLRDGTRSILHGGEKDLLAMYLTAGRRFPTDVDLVVVDNGIWDHFVNRPEYQAKKEADRDSYAWDGIVDIFSEDVLRGRLEFGAGLNQNERGLRAMATESRFARRVLGKAFMDFFERASRNDVRARFVKSPSNVGYVFLARPHGYPRDARLNELDMRCFVARGLHPDISTVVGLATEQYTQGKGFSFDLVHLHMPKWTPAHQEHMVRVQSEFSYFTQPQERRSSEDEYTNVGQGTPSR